MNQHVIESLPALWTLVPLLGRAVVAKLEMLVPSTTNAGKFVSVPVRL